MKLATITAPESDYGHDEKGDALHSMEIALAMERLNLQVSCCFISHDHPFRHWLVHIPELTSACT